MNRTAVVDIKLDIILDGTDTVAATVTPQANGNQTNVTIRGHQIL